MRLIDADALKREQMKAFNCENATKYGNKDAKQQEHSYSTIMLYEVSDIIEDTIDNAPTVEIRDNFDIGYVQGLEDGHKRPNGKWIRKTVSFPPCYDDILVYECSECKSDFVYHDSTTKFCPECGADMREADNETN